METRRPADPLPPLQPRSRWNVFRVPALARRWGRHTVFGVFAFASTCVSLAVVAVLADAVGQPLVVPSLGPTAFIVFDNPRAPSASPRNALFGHAVGIGAGYLALWAFGLTHTAVHVHGGLSADRVAAAALSLGLTAGVMALTGLTHPPAAATTLVVSLGSCGASRRAPPLWAASSCSSPRASSSTAWPVSGTRSGGPARGPEPGPRCPPCQALPFRRWREGSRS
jgi:hypothetical protein